jgi:hypothetical protein
VTRCLKENLPIHQFCEPKLITSYYWLDANVAESSNWSLQLAISFLEEASPFPFQCHAPVVGLNVAADLFVNIHTKLIDLTKPLGLAVDRGVGLWLFTVAQAGAAGTSDKSDR